MKTHITRSLTIAISLIFMGCNTRVDDVTLFPGIDKVTFLGHKGSGTMGKYGNFYFPGNTFSAVQNGINELDGVEFDLQLSRDSTLWLFHDHEIENCKQELINFSLLKDSEIEVINETCYGNQLITLNAVLEKLPDTLKKYISLDIKALQNSVLIDHVGGKVALANVIAKRLTILQQYPHFNFMIEVPFNDQLQAFAGLNASVNILCNTLSNCTTREHEGAEGASINYHNLIQKDTSFIQNSGFLTSQVWVVNDASSLKKVLLYKPDFIQTDNLAMIRAARSESFNKIKSTFKSTTVIKTEYTELYTESDSSNPYFLKISFDSDRDVPHDEASLVYTVKVNDSTVHWQDLTLRQGQNEHLFYVSAGLHSPEETPIDVNVYIWNRLNKSFELDNTRTTTFSTSQ